MPKQDYNEQVKGLCSDGTILIKAMAATLVATHAQDHMIATAIAGSDQFKDDGDDFLKNYEKVLRGTVTGTTQFVMLVAEIYRVLVNDGVIKPVDAVKVAKHLGVDHDNILEMVKKITESDPAWERLLSTSLFTIDGINDMDDIEEDVDDAESDAKQLINRAKKMAKKEAEEEDAE